MRVVGDRLGHEPVDAPQEGGEGLARAGRREDQGVLAGGDGRPALGLGRGGVPKVVSNQVRTGAENGDSGMTRDSSTGEP